MKALIAFVILAIALRASASPQVVGGGANGPLQILLLNNFDQEMNYDVFQSNHYCQYFSCDCKGTQFSYTYDGQRYSYSSYYFKSWYQSSKTQMTATSQSTAGQTTTQTFSTPFALFTMIITYIPTELEYLMTFTIQNTGSLPLTDVFIGHGGDTYFANNDKAASYYDPNYALGMVKIQNPGYSTTEFMGVYAISEPFTYYFGGHFRQGGHWLNNEATYNVIDSQYKDAGIYVQWRHTQVSAGASWTVVAGETIFACPYGQVLVNGICKTVNVQNSICNAGNYIDAETGNCLPCPAGQYSDQINSAQCTLCPVETFAAVEGSTSCSDCPAATYADEGSATCTPCPFSDCAECQNPSNRDTCTACQPGWYFFQLPSHYGCVDHCPFGYYPFTSDMTCYECDWVSLRASVPASWCDINCCVPGTSSIQDGSNIASGCRADYPGYEYHQVCQWNCPNQFYNANGCNEQVKTCSQWTTMPNYPTWQTWCNTYCDSGMWQCKSSAGSQQICACSAWN